MKKISLMIALLMGLWIGLHAQTPQSFTYSAVARNVNGQPLASSLIGVQISILKNSSSGPVQYSENHFVNTDPFGLFNILIGGGSVQSGNITSVDWKSDVYFLKVSMDVGGGTNFTPIDTTQFLSVPYSLFAQKTASVKGGSTFSHYIGEQFGGGIIFHLWRDAQGIEHGLIAALFNTASAWSNITASLIGPAAQSTWDGLGNSNSIIAQSGFTNGAAGQCLGYSYNGFTGWYLPSIDELSLLWHNRFIINKALSSISGSNPILDNAYWSSTEVDNDQALYIFTGTATPQVKSWTNYVRPVRAF